VQKEVRGGRQKANSKGAVSCPLSNCSLAFVDSLGAVKEAFGDGRRPAAFSKRFAAFTCTLKLTLVSQISLDFSYTPDSLDSLSSEQLAILTFPSLHQSQPPDPFVAAEARALLMKRRIELERETGLRGQGEPSSAQVQGCRVRGASC
jgi:hypothetical protein